MSNSKNAGGGLFWLALLIVAGLYFFYPGSKKAVDTKIAQFRGSDRSSSASQTPQTGETPTGPPVRLAGRVIQRINQGLLVAGEVASDTEIESARAEAWDKYAVFDSGKRLIYTLQDVANVREAKGQVSGTLLVTGHPRESDIVDDDRIKIVARPYGIYRYDTVRGSTKTIRIYRYESDFSK
jgi:hypothetical protein